MLDFLQSVVYKLLSWLKANIINTSFESQPNLVSTALSKSFLRTLTLWSEVGVLQVIRQLLDKSVLLGVSFGMLGRGY